MPSEQMGAANEPLETATELERAGIVKRSCAYKLAKQGIIPSYLVGPKQTGVRFRRSEVLTALRRPAKVVGCGDVDGIAAEIRAVTR